MQPGVLSQVHEAAGELSVQLYQRVPRSKALPAFGKLFREKIAPKDPTDIRGPREQPQASPNPRWTRWWRLKREKHSCDREKAGEGREVDRQSRPQPGRGDWRGTLESCD